MKTSDSAGALLLGALILGGCAASTTQGAQVRVHVRTAAFEQDSRALSQTTQLDARRARKESPLLRACKSGSSKSCNELGDRLALKHAHAEARQWYLTSCERVSTDMMPSATRLTQLSQELAQLGSAASDDEQLAAKRSKEADLKSEASEMRARIQGCLDVGETLKLDAELKQSLKYFDTVCEFSTLVEAVGAAVPGLEYATETGCTAGQSVRAQLSSEEEFSPQLFAKVAAQPVKPAAAKRSAAKEEASMVFSESDL